MLLVPTPSIQTEEMYKPLCMLNQLWLSDSRKRISYNLRLHLTYCYLVTLSCAGVLDLLKLTNKILQVLPDKHTVYDLGDYIHFQH